MFRFRRSEAFAVFLAKAWGRVRRRYSPLSGDGSANLRPGSLRALAGALAFLVVSVGRVVSAVAGGRSCVAGLFGELQLAMGCNV